MNQGWSEDEGGDEGYSEVQNKCLENTSFGIKIAFKY